MNDSLFEDKYSMTVSLQTKTDLQKAIKQLCAPLQSCFNDDNTAIHIGQTTAVYGRHIAGIETFSRPLWGIGPLIAGGGSLSFLDQFVAGIEHGTDPSHPSFWGYPGDYDQRIVEMAAFGLALGLDRQIIWSRLSQRARSHLYQWLNVINQCQTVDNNWILFKVMVNTGFSRLGLPVDEDAVETALEDLERFYLGDGWYSDGVTPQKDYYVSFAIHYYCLIYAAFRQNEDPERAQRYKDRAAIFAEDFMYWFSSDGSAIPFGRSMTYRFAQAAFWSALAFAEVDVFPQGVLKGIILRHLRWWFRQPMFDQKGLLTIGYSYPNLLISENYNAPGSPYWGLKVFLILALPQHHPFWQADEQPLPVLTKTKPQKHPQMILNRDDQGKHVYALTSGQYALGDFEHTAEKYSKFAYSNLFGFSVTKDSFGLANGAFDSALALSEQDGYYRMRRWCETVEVYQNVLYSKWRPWQDVEISTWLIPIGMWHVRLHRICNQRPLDTAEGGFAIAKQADLSTEVTSQSVLTQSSYGYSGLVDLRQRRSPEAITTMPNTNVLYPDSSWIPTLKQSLPPGDHWLAAAVLAHTHFSVFDAYWSQSPYLREKMEGYQIYDSHGHFLSFIAKS